MNVTILINVSHTKTLQYDTISAKLTLSVKIHSKNKTKPKRHD